MAAVRPLPLVTHARPSHEAFAACLLAVVQEHGDIAREACWQHLRRLIVAHWPVLCRAQKPQDT